MSDIVIHPLGQKKQQAEKVLTNTQSTFYKNDSKSISTQRPFSNTPIKYVYIHHPQINILFH